MTDSKGHEVDGFRWHEREAGAATAPVVVLVHGFMVSSRYMAPLMRELSADHHVIAPDLPGFGRTRCNRTLTTLQLAEELAHWLEATDLKDVTLVGHSYGAAISVEASLRVPDRVARVVLIGATVDPSAATVRDQVLRLLANIWREPLWFWFVAARDLLDCGVGRFVRTLRAVASHDMLTAVRKLDKPLLVVRGEHDAVCPADWADRLAEAGNAGAVITVPGAAHTANVSRPRVIARCINGFRLSPE